MNRLANLMPNLFGKQDVDPDAPLTDEELAELKRERHRHAPKHGPYGVGGSRVVKFMSSGQQRRAQERWTKTRSRKANKAYRRQWMANEAAFQRLLSQVGLLERRPDSALVPGVERVLIERYGSVEEARTHLASLIQERMANNARRAS